MTLYQVLILLAAGAAAGFVSGFFGVGGAIILIPFLLFLGLTQHQAQGTSLMVLVVPVGIFAVMNYAKQGYVNFKYAWILVAAFVVGSYFGSLVTLNISEKMLQKSFAVLLFLISLKIFFNK